MVGGTSTICSQVAVFMDFLFLVVHIATGPIAAAVQKYWDFTALRRGPAPVLCSEAGAIPRSGIGGQE
jgi:hypothetical protein